MKSEYSVEKCAKGKWHVVRPDGISVSSYLSKIEADIEAARLSVKRKRQSAWVYVWQDRGKVVSKLKVFTSMVSEAMVARYRINKQVRRPEGYPEATARVIGRTAL